MKTTIKNKKTVYANILFALSFLFCLFLGISNYFKFSHLEKYGTEQTAVVESFTLKKSYRPKHSYSYSVKIEYHLEGSDKKQICRFYHKPAAVYTEGQIFTLLNDEEKNIKIPAAELEAAKRKEITGYFIYSALVLIFALFYHLIDLKCDKNRNTNKWRKKQWKKNPELKEKDKRKQTILTYIFLIFLFPFILLQALIDSVFKKDNKKHGKKRGK